MQVVCAPTTMYPSWMPQSPSGIPPLSLSQGMAPQIQIPTLGGEDARKQVEKHLLEDEIRRLRGKVATLNQEVKEHKRKLKKRKVSSDDLVTALSNLCDKLAEEKATYDAKKAIQEVLNQFGTKEESSEDINKKPKVNPRPVETRTLSDHIAANLSHYGPQHNVRLAYSHCVNGCESEASHCKPCRFIFSVDKKPLRLLKVSVQQQYTVSKKETLDMTPEQKSKLMPATVRIMGTPEVNNLYFVAKDVCLLIHIRKGNVAKSISQFSDSEKARMPVLCERSNGVVSTHVLTVLTVSGVVRLLTTSQSKHAPAVLKWISGHIEVITGQKVSSDLKVASSSSSSSTTSSSSSCTSSSSSSSASVSSTSPEVEERERPVSEHTHSPSLSTRNSKKAFQPLSNYSSMSPVMFPRTSLTIPSPVSPVPFSPLFSPVPYSSTPGFATSPFLPPTLSPSMNPSMNSFLMAMTPRTSATPQHCGTSLMGLPPSPMNSLSFLNPLQIPMSLGPKSSFELFPSGPI